MATHDILHLIQLCEIKLWKELKEKKTLTQNYWAPYKYSY